MDGNVRAANYYNYGTAAPTIKAMVDAETRRVNIPPAKEYGTKEKILRLEQAKTSVRTKTSGGISVFAIFGTLFVAVLMVFVVLAQINFKETAGETVKINNYINELNEKHKALELAFERAIDIREVERYARDELGMSKPDSDQIIVISTAPRDSAIVLNDDDDRGLRGFGEFIKSLTVYFK